ncbi:hypothetical protein K432DRAFT_426134 [Lepidopterella palustris CBS 459.81]|uniref:ABC transporter domain-containing protein n=1 Tax=Lepidopterella palustris CBS 459.81 TaxID=1314670 RepID=A0A8E2JEW1_9PEZI|nr:hypothetical protein K432DRAFT_426134 [Lepidopterella palustris CBS 459.81]
MIYSEDSRYEWPSPEGSTVSGDQNYASEDRKIDITHTGRPVAELIKRLSRRWTGLTGVPVVDPFDTKHPQWTFEHTLRAAVERAKNDSAAAISPNVSLRWKDVKVYGSSVGATTQKGALSFFNDIINLPRLLWKRTAEKEILHGIDGVLNEGEMLLVLGGRASGCSTLLKTLAGQTAGYTGWHGSILYSGIPVATVMHQFRGCIVYNSEVESHFPELTVAQTLEFAASTKTPHQRIYDVSRKAYARKMRDILGTAFGLRHTFDTKVGNDFIRGVSGGERRRVTIAEMLMTRASVTYWDNPTRGLDSSTSLEFAEALRVATNLTRNVSVSALYQPGDALAEIYDKVTLLYQGYQIWFGDLDSALDYFVDMGFECLPRQTTAEFLISITDPNATRIRKGFECKVPRSPAEFVLRWKTSTAYHKMLLEILDQENRYPENNEDSMKRFKDHLAGEKAPFTLKSSPYTLNLWMQFVTTFVRAYQRIRGQYVYFLALTITMVVIPVIIGSMFFNIPNDTSGFFSRSGVIFFSILFNVIVNFAEVSSQFSQRSIVEKHNSYAMYHPFIDALATMISQYPLKLLNVVMFSAIVYFIANLKREIGPFFINTLFTYILSLTMTGIFRTIATLAATIETALSCTGLTILPLAIYSGFIIPRPTMHPWFKWISFVNPIYYANEAQMAVEFHGRKAPCTMLVPSGPGFENVQISNQVCAVTGAKPGQAYVLGDDYISLSFDYSYSHVWRNLGICIGFFIFFTITYAVATEFKKSTVSKSEHLVFRKSPRDLRRTRFSDDEEERPIAMETLDRYERKYTTLVGSNDVFCWQNINYDIEIKGEKRRLLNNVQGYVKPGTLTALLGSSGAGKTTLLNVLAQRVATGIITGDALVNGSPLDRSFQRRTGYVQQQDVHLAELTVREAFRFSALLRQPRDVPVAEKYEYVEKIISTLGLQQYADAVIGVPEQGLSAEKRKRITIGLELVAKPSLLLFLDEPTSGLDSQSAWSIIKFLRELADAGQAIICTIHQPSATLFEQFDRLLVLAKGGQTVYFGDLGKNSTTVTEYFERNGAPMCAPTANPAEYILDVIGAGANSHSLIDWTEVWKTSPEYFAITSQIRNFKFARRTITENNTHLTDNFATSWFTQYWAVQKRLFQQHWRSPVYINGKLIINIVGGLFLAFTFYMEKSSIQGLQNKTFAIFMILLLCLILIVLLQPRMIELRDLYEVRERYSKMYHWTTFVIANIIVEIPFNFVIASLGFICWYFPVGWWQDVSAARGAFMWFIFMLYQLYHTTFAQTIAIVSPNSETAAMITILFYTFILAFSGVVQPLRELVSFWKFAYYVSPFTWLVSAMMSTGTHNVPVHCADAEINTFQPPHGQTCGAYAGAFANASMAAIYNPEAKSNCQFCLFSVADAYLTGVNIHWNNRWRNAAFLVVYVAFNVFLFFVAFYYHSNDGFRGLGPRLKVFGTRATKFFKKYFC